MAQNRTYTPDMTHIGTVESARRYRALSFCCQYVMCWLERIKRRTSNNNQCISSAEKEEKIFKEVHIDVSPINMSSGYVSNNPTVIRADNAYTQRTIESILLLRAKQRCGRFPILVIFFQFLSVIIANEERKMEDRLLLVIPILIIDSLSMQLRDQQDFHPHPDFGSSSCHFVSLSLQISSNNSFNIFKVCSNGRDAHIGLPDPLVQLGLANGSSKLKWINLFYRRDRKRTIYKKCIAVRLQCEK